MHMYHQQYRYVLDLKLGYNPFSPQLSPSETQLSPKGTMAKPKFTTTKQKTIEYTSWHWICRTASAQHTLTPVNTSFIIIVIEQN